MATRVRKKVLSIGVSDSSGGTGVQGDLKTFSALGVHGTSVITGITAQNTKGVQQVHPLQVKVIRAQMDSIFGDLQPSAVKTGLLLTSKIVQHVARRLNAVEVPLVVDPVMTGTYGETLISEETIHAMRDHLVPMATLVTPNLHEASALVGWEVDDLGDMSRAAAEIHDLGCKAVLITGGHLSEGAAIDVLYDGKVRKLKAERFAVDLLGTGSALSALITALLAKGYRPRDACKTAKEMVTTYIRHGYDIGEGVDVVEPFAALSNEAEKYRVLQELRLGLRRLERTLPPDLVPHSGANLGFGLTNVNGRKDVCALNGRVLQQGPHVRAAGPVDFGSRDPIASTVVVVMQHDHRVRCALRIAYDAGFVAAAKSLNMTVGRFDFAEMPKDEADSEGWGVQTAIEDLGSNVPDLIVDEGGHGHEAQIRVLGSTPKAVVGKLRMVVGEIND